MPKKKKEPEETSTVDEDLDELEAIFNPKETEEKKGEEEKGKKEEEVKKVETEEEEEIEEEETADELEEIRQRMNKMAGLMESGKKVEESTKEEEGKKPTAEKKEEAAIERFLDEADELTAEGLNKAFSKMSAQVQQAILQAVTGPLVARVNNAISLQMGIRDFYEANKDLVPYKNYVGLKASQLTEAHPDWDMPTLMDNLGKEVRSDLKVAKEVGEGGSETEGGPQGRKPAFGKKRGTERNVPAKKSGLQGELAELSRNR